MRRAFVTGGAGFLGSNLVGELLAGGWQVLVFDRMTSSAAARLEQLGATLLVGDVTDAAACERAMPDQIDAVFHVAANTSHWRLGDALQTKVNVDGTRVVVATALARRARRFVHTSSIAAYGFQPDRITEETPSTALDSSINYFRTKRLAELEVHRGMERGLDAIILNPANIIGPFDYAGWSRFFTLIAAGRLPGVPPGKASFGHVRAVARAHAAAFEHGRSGHHYLLGGVDATFLEVVRQIGTLLERKVPARPTPAFLSAAVAQIAQWTSHVTRREPDLTPEKATLLSAELVCSSDKAERELGYEIVPLDTMLEDCRRWMTEEGLLSDD